MMPNKVSNFQDSPFIKLLKETNQNGEQRCKLIKTLERSFDAKIITYFTSFRKRVQIDNPDAEMMESILSSEPSDKKIVLILSSPGGQGMAAERIANLMRAYSSDRFEVIVPHMAKSAATMICFGASVIHMSKTAELGPVDPQVPYWTTGDEEEPDWISAEEYVRSYDKLIQLSTGGKAKRLEPFIQQLTRYDSRYIEKLRSAQKLSEDISVRLLKAGMMKSKSTAKIRKSIDVFLTQTRTNAHGRMINHSEAVKCGLAIKLIDLHSPTWHALWELYVRTDWCVNNRCGKLIETAYSSVTA